MDAALQLAKSRLRWVQMSAEIEDTLESLISELVASRAHEDVIITRISGLASTVPPGDSNRVATIVVQARELFGSGNARRLTSPHSDVGGETPIQHVRTPEGAWSVEQLVGRLRYGVCV